MNSRNWCRNNICDDDDDDESRVSEEQVVGFKIFEKMVCVRLLVFLKFYPKIAGPIFFLGPNYHICTAKSNIEQLKCKDHKKRDPFLVSKMEFNFQVFQQKKKHFDRVFSN